LVSVNHYTVTGSLAAVRPSLVMLLVPFLTVSLLLSSMLNPLLPRLEITLDVPLSRVPTWKIQVLLVLPDVTSKEDNSLMKL